MKSPQHGALAFMPWFAIEQPTQLGRLRLLPFRRGQLPGDLPNLSQRDIDAILAPYVDAQNGKPITKATLVETEYWRNGQAPGRSLDTLFRYARSVSMAALSRRRLFGGHFGYCNSHDFQLIVQGFKYGKPGSMAITLRRRDGSSQTYWASSLPAFHRPLHVARSTRPELDEPLLRALVRLPRKWSAIHESIVEFVSANTDSPDIPQHSEVVMMKSALDWLLGCGYECKDFIAALCRVVPNSKRPFRGPLASKWVNKNRKGAASWRPLMAWAQEFCLYRNASAHGGQRALRDPVWSAHAHLAFAATLFPLLLKQWLNANHLYGLTEEDRIRLSGAELLLAHDPMRARLDRAHPWEELTQSLILHDTIERIYDRIEGQMS